MIPSPIVKVLSTIQKHGVKALLMGGQACVFYGAAEFSRDVDLVILADPENLQRLRAALDDLQATRVFVPRLDEDFLRRGHGVHFKCGIPEASRIRIDVMSKMRGVDAFEKLWDRRTTIADRDGNEYHLLSLADLVQAKKTQRDKDWPMITRLVEANFVEHERNPTEAQIRFWLREMRTPRDLIAIAQRFPRLTIELQEQRPLLRQALAGETDALEESLGREQQTERERDRAYWQPLKTELEQLRRDRNAE